MKPKLNYIGDITSPTWYRNILRQLFPWKYTSLLVTLIAHRQQKPLKVQFLICGHDFSLKGSKDKMLSTGCEETAGLMLC